MTHPQHNLRIRNSVNITGFQLLELLIGLAILSILVMIAYPSYTAYLDRTNNALAASDIQTISLAIERFYVINNRYPDSLAEAHIDNMRDPWGKPYQYLRIDGAGLKGKGQLRKDKFLVPVNSDYDLYSMGKDGESVPPFTAKKSHDDIVRANNGKYIGPASGY